MAKVASWEYRGFSVGGWVVDYRNHCARLLVEVGLSIEGLVMTEHVR